MRFRKRDSSLDLNSKICKNGKGRKCLNLYEITKRYQDQTVMKAFLFIYCYCIEFNNDFITFFGV